MMTWPRPSPRVLRVDDERADLGDARAERRQFAARQHDAVALTTTVKRSAMRRDVGERPRQQVPFGQVVP